MKTTFTLLIIILSLASFAKAQNVAQPDTIPYSVLMKVKDVTTAINISSDKELALSRFFQKEEELYTNASKNGLSGQQVNVLKSQLKAEFESLLTTQELRNYSVKRRGALYAKPDTIIRKIN